MQYRQLGKAGIRISELSLGPWLTFSKSLSVKHARELAGIGFDHGVNLFDNAERYAEGMAEALMGEVIKCFRRESLVIATKLYWGGTGPNDVGLSRKHLMEGIKNSLRRLQLDYVDLLFCHRPDEFTPIEETVQAMDSIIRSGYALYWGTSEWTSSQIRSAYQISKDNHCIPPSMEQAEYNLYQRHRVEQEYKDLYQIHGMGLTTWSPLACGVLTGKYNDGIPSDSRLATQERLIASDFVSRVAKANALKSLAQDLGCTSAQLALAWCLKNENVSSVIMGASNADQLRENLMAVDLKTKIDEEVLAILNGIFPNH